MTQLRYQFLGEPGQQLTVTGTVREKKIIHTRRRSATAHWVLTPWLLRIECGQALLVVVTSARWAGFTHEGDEVRVEGVVKEHRLWNEERITLFNHAQRLDWSFEGELRRWRRTPKWEVVNPTQAGPRPFPGQADPLATTQATFIAKLFG